MRRGYLGLLFIGLQAVAHPHMWIDVEVQPVQNAEGQIRALRQKWLFDPFSSALLTEEMVQAADDAQRQQLWQALQNDIRRTLSEEGLYTFPRGDFAPPEQLQLHFAHDELWLEAELPLLLPTQQLRYQIYEPEYYVEILHSAAQQRQVGNCRLTLQAAEPDEEKLLEAAALDKNAKGDPNLGRFFAETAEWDCE